MKIKIFYCVVWNYEPRAVGLAAELKKAYGVDSELVSEEKREFWSDIWWQKSFFQAETVQVSLVRGSFKNHQEVTFKKEDTHLEMHDSSMITLTILWAKLLLNLLQYFFRGFNWFEVW